MKSNERNKEGKFLDGFFWGAAIGGGVAYILSTKKGRDVVRGLIQEGVNALENFVIPEEAMEAPQAIGDIQTMREVQEPQETPPLSEEKDTAKVGKVGFSTKRFFQSKKK